LACHTRDSEANPAMHLKWIRLTKVVAAIIYSAFSLHTGTVRFLHKFDTHWRRYTFNSPKSETVASDSGVRVVEIVTTNGAPRSVDEYFQTTLVGDVLSGTSQSHGLRYIDRWTNRRASTTVILHSYSQYNTSTVLYTSRGADNYLSKRRTYKILCASRSPITDIVAMLCSG